MGIYDPDLDRVMSNDKHIGFCADCGREALKKRMITVLVKERQYGNPRVICHFCPECYYNFLERYAIGN